jgi:hypothetical protein
MGTVPWKQASEIATTTALQEKIRDGLLYMASYCTPDASPIADNAQLYCLIQTLEKVVSFIPRANTGGDAEMLLYRDAQFSNAGTDVIVANMNQNSIGLPTATVTHTPTITDSGFPIQHIFMPGQILGSQTPLVRDTRWILKENANYLLEIINREGSAVSMSVEFIWWEE